MADKKDTPARAALSLPVLIICIALSLAAGFGGGLVVRGQSGDQKTMVVLEDGVPLGDKLDSIQEAVGKVPDGMNDKLDKANALLLGEFKKALEGKVAEMTVPPIEQFDLRDLSSYPTKGNPEPVITMVEFSDFQCPYCARMARALDELVEKYGGKVRLVFVDRPLISEYRDGYPFHPYAYVAHEAAQEALAQGKFWEMYEYIFEHQKEIFPSRPKSSEDYEEKTSQVREKLVQAAQELGLDAEKMRQSLNSHAHKQRLDANIALSNAMGINSTPTVYVDGYFKMNNPNSILKLLQSARQLD